MKVTRVSKPTSLAARRLTPYTHKMSRVKFKPSSRQPSMRKKKSSQKAQWTLRRKKNKQKCTCRWEHMKERNCTLTLYSNVSLKGNCSVFNSRHNTVQHRQCSRALSLQASFTEQHYSCFSPTLRPLTATIHTLSCSEPRAHLSIQLPSHICLNPPQPK